MTPTVLAVACLIAVTLGYVLLCAVSPFGRCRKCNGLGLIHPTRGFRRRPRPCKRCRATGLRLRIGRRVHNHGARAAEAARRVRHDANR